ncbi:MAG: cadherin-like beta sandwich domain-containing protein [Clostridia bacterium]|nr:cadherin-like beta sandwich domain-containing protein [Clostridia bacterium]
MRKHSIRLSALVLVLLIILTPMIMLGEGALSARAASAPSFYIRADKSSAKTGDLITVSLYVTNDTGSVITSFDGEITFNSNHFSYQDFEYQQALGQKLTCVDYNAANTSKISFTYADPSRAYLGTGKTDVLLLRVRFRAVSRYNGSGQIIGQINNCYSGKTAFEDIPLSQAQVTVGTTAAATTTTTAPHVTTTTATTTTTAVRSSNAKLSDLSLSAGQLTPAFSPDFVAYNATVPHDIADIRITASAQSPSAVVSGIGVHELAFGMNSFAVTVTAEDGSIMQYGVNIYREEEINEMQVGIGEEDDGSDNVSESDSVQIAIDEQDVQPDYVDGNALSFDGDALKIVGIVFAEIALFFFGFLSGFFIDKNIKKKALIEQSLGELTRQFEQYGGQYDEQYGDYGEYDDSYDRYNDASDYDEYGGMNGLGGGDNNYY